MDTPVQPAESRTGRQHTPDGRLRGSEAPMDGRCGAKLEDTDPPRYCCRWPAKDRTRCRRHGGATPKGISHYRYSGARPLQGIIGRDYQASLDNTELLHISPDIAILDARVKDLCRRMDNGERESTIEVIRDTVTDALDSQAQGKLDLPALLTTLKALCDRHMERESVWRALDAAVHSRAKLVDAEMRRQVAAQETATRAEVAHLMNQVALAIRSRILTTLPDAQLQRQLLTDLQADLTALGTHHPAVARPVPAPVADAVLSQD